MLHTPKPPKPPILATVIVSAIGTIGSAILLVCSDIGLIQLKNRELYMLTLVSSAASLGISQYRNLNQ